MKSRCVDQTSIPTATVSERLYHQIVAFLTNHLNTFFKLGRKIVPGCISFKSVMSCDQPKLDGSLLFANT